MTRKKDDNPIGFVITMVCLFVIILVIMSAIVSCDVKGTSSGCYWEKEKNKSPFSHSLTKTGPGSRPSFTKTRPQPRPNVKPKPVTPRYTRSHPAPKPTKPLPAGYHYEWECD